MIDMSKWRSNDLANALLTRSMQAQASSPVEAFGQIAQSLMARSAIERNDASNNSLLAQALMGTELPESSRAAVMTSGSPNTPVHALLQNEQAKAAAAQQQADAGWKMIGQRDQRSRSATANQRSMAEVPPHRPIGAEEAGLIRPPAGQANQMGPDTGTAMILAPNDGMTFNPDPRGDLRAAQGAAEGGGKPLTERQSTDTAFTNRMSGANDILAENPTALTGFGDRALEYIPAGWGLTYQDKDYQLAKQAGHDFLSAILGRDTSAVMSPEEMALYGDMFLPTLGESKASLEQKAASRTRAVEAMRAGTPALTIAAQEMARRKTEAANPPPLASDVPVPSGVSPLEWQFMTPEERRLFQ